jgi:hypothetical protein
MNQEANRLSAESRDIHRQTQKLATATITLNTEIRKLNEESTVAARANQAAAAKTSLSTRVNVEVIFPQKRRLGYMQANRGLVAAAYYTVWYGSSVLRVGEGYFFLH